MCFLVVLRTASVILGSCNLEVIVLINLHKWCVCKISSIRILALKHIELLNLRKQIFAIMKENEVTRLHWKPEVVESIRCYFQCSQKLLSERKKNIFRNSFIYNIFPVAGKAFEIVSLHSTSMF